MRKIRFPVSSTVTAKGRDTPSCAVNCSEIVSFNTGALLRRSDSSWARSWFPYSGLGLTNLVRIVSSIAARSTFPNPGTPCKDISSDLKTSSRWAILHIPKEKWHHGRLGTPFVCGSVTMPVHSQTSFNTPDFNNVTNPVLPSTRTRKGTSRNLTDRTITVSKRRRRRSRDPSSIPKTTVPDRIAISPKTDCRIFMGIEGSSPRRGPHAVNLPHDRVSLYDGILNHVLRGRSDTMPVRKSSRRNNRRRNE